MVSLDRRTKRYADIEPVTVDELVGRDSPLAARAQELLDLPPLALDVAGATCTRGRRGRRRSLDPDGLTDLVAGVRSTTNLVFAGSVALGRIDAREGRSVDVGSDGSSEFGERCGDAPMGSGVATEFVVAAANVLHQRVALHDHLRGSAALEASHRSQPRFELCMVRFDSIVRVPLGVVERGRNQLIDDPQQGPRPIGHNLDRLAVNAKRRREEPSRSVSIPAG